MSVQIQEIKINGRVADFSFEGLGYRLQRYVQSSTNFSSKGGDYSTQVTFPLTKNNKKIFNISTHLSGINKFNRVLNYIVEIRIDGVEVLNGIFKLDSITNDMITGDFISNNISWVDELSNISLSEIGYINGVPTWTQPFFGGSTINDLNIKNNKQTDILCPTIVYNNTPITDYLDFTNVQMNGTYDVSGNQLVAPLEFPDSFELKNGFFGLRQGLTFEDFPIAVYYPNLLKKIFDNIGYNITGEIFDLEWFNKIYMPYTGNGYMYNYKTLGHLYSVPTSRLQTANTALEMFTKFDSYQEAFGNTALNPFFSVGMTQQNIPLTDNVGSRIDYVSNFKKFLVSDKTAEYVCPADGRYKIRLKSSINKKLRNVASGVVYLDTTNSHWDDSVLVLLRKDKEGNIILDDEYRKNIQRWITGENPNFGTNPSDVIAAFNPKVYNATGYGIDSAITPLTLNTELITVVGNPSHVKQPATASQLEVQTAAEISVEVDMLKNERIGAYWITFTQMKDLQINWDYVWEADVTVNVTGSEFVIDYLCGIEDLDIAGNLPNIDCKTFVSSFFNQFNLNFTVNEDSKTIVVSFADNYHNDTRDAYRIDDRVDINSLVILPIEVPKKLIVGYSNDPKDYLLSLQIGACSVNQNVVNNYSNVYIQENNNIYAEGELNVTSIFSSTKFVEGNINLLNLSTSPTYSLSNFTIGGYIFEQIIKGIIYTGDKLTYKYKLPSIQSELSFNANKFSDLEYDYEYQPRLLYHLGTIQQYFGVSTGMSIPIDAPEFQLRLNSGFWIQPTVSSFDTENFNPYPTLRYDGFDGIFNNYFSNTIDELNKTHILKLIAYLKTSDWKQMKGNKLIKFQDDIYKLIEIIDYDPSLEEPATIKLIKVI